MQYGVTIVTGFDKAAWDAYARENLLRMVHYFPMGTRFLVYPWGEGYAFCKKLLRFVSVMPTPLALHKFIADYGHDQMAHGAKYDPARTPLWRDKEIRNGYSFRYDAMKFCKMAIQTADAAFQCETPCMIRLDADVRCFMDIPSTFGRQLFEHHDLVYLGRRGTFSETGFVGFRGPRA